MHEHTYEEKLLKPLPLTPEGKEKQPVLPVSFVTESQVLFANTVLC